VKTVVREAKIREERSALVEVLVQELEGWADGRKFDWLYLDNPFGEARCWVLEEETGDVVGVSAAFPRMLRHGAQDVRGWVLGDFCVAQKLRSLGPAVRLQRAAFEAVDRGEMNLWYDFPSRSMMAVYRRMGADRVGELARMVYLLKADRAIEERIESPMLARGLSAAGNTLLASRAALARRDTSVAVSARDGDFDASPSSGFDLDTGVSLNRTADYLNWRYRRDPRERPSILSETGAGDGSIVYRPGWDDVEIVDVFGASDGNVLRELVLAVVDEARESGATSVSVRVSDGHPWMDVLGAAGFRKRESGPFVVYSRDAAWSDPAKWFLFAGDRELV